MLQLSRKIRRNLALIAGVSLGLTLLPAMPASWATARPVKPKVTRTQVPEASARADSRAQNVAPPEKTAEPSEISLPDFRTIGVSWRGELPTGSQIEVRVRENGQWGGWQQLPAQDSGPDPTGPDAARAAARRATEPLVTGPADGAQVRLRSATGAPAAPPSDLEVVSIDPGTSAADSTAGRTPGSAAAAVAAPRILTRAEWGADESLVQCNAGYTSTIKVGFVHHTAGTNSYAPSEAPGIVRSIYAYHVNGNGWCDIGYNFLVDRYGVAYEGRRGGMDKPVLGAHTGGFNSNSFAVSAIGNFMTEATPSVMLDKIAAVLAWKLSLHGADPTGRTTLVSAGGSYTRYASGTVVPLNVVSGHRDPGITDCPGDVLYGQLATLRTKAAAYLAPASTFTDVPADHPFHDDIEWAAGAGITTGWPAANGTRVYRPAEPVARDAMAAFLYRLAGQPGFAAPAASPFVDVPTTHPYYREIAWLAATSGATGYPEPDGTRTYRPLDPVARDAMAAFLYRLAGRPAFAAPATSPFTDVATTHPFYAEITWLHSTGIGAGWTESDGTRTFRPGLPVARDAMAAFLHRFSSEVM